MSKDVTDLLFEQYQADFNEFLDSRSKKSQSASVVGRGILGGVIAGPAGAIIGALSAADKNNRNKK